VPERLRLPPSRVLANEVSISSMRSSPSSGRRSRAGPRLSPLPSVGRHKKMT